MHQVRYHVVSKRELKIQTKRNKLNQNILCNHSAEGGRCLGLHSKRRLLTLHSLQRFNIPIKNPIRILWTALCLRVKLDAADGAGIVTNALIRPIIYIPPRLCPALGQRGRVDRVPVILTGDMASAGQKVEGRDVLSTIAILEFDGLGTGGEGDKLMT